MYLSHNFSHLDSLLGSIFVSRTEGNRSFSISPKIPASVRVKGTGPVRGFCLGEQDNDVVGLSYLLVLSKINEFSSNLGKILVTAVEGDVDVAVLIRLS